MAYLRAVSDNPFNPELWQPVKGFADLTDILYPQTVSLYIDSKVAEHLALVGQEARITALAWLERENVVADESLQPFHAVVAGDADLAPVREIGEPNGLTHCLIFLDPFTIVSGHVPSGDLFERGVKLCMEIVDA